MAPTAVSQSTKSQTMDFQEAMEEEAEANLRQEIKQLLPSLPKEKGWRTAYLYQFQGFWCQATEIQAISTFQNHFQAKDSDIILASIPKSGTTWLKALTFAVLKRNLFSASSKNHPLINSNPHELVPFFEYQLFANNQIPELSRKPDPRIFGTHIPFPSLPSSIKKSNCKIVYICRNPLDTFVSSWHFSNKIKPDSKPPLKLDEVFDLYCEGIVGFGPFWSHMLGYWEDSKERPKNVMFLKYEDLKEDINFHLKRLADFLDCPFTLEEEKGGVIGDIIKLCSFEKMKDLEVNKSGNVAGMSIKNFEKKNLFRKGEIGDWVNHFTPCMLQRLSEVIGEKFGGSGFSFRITS